jgi:hypothetical protein
MSVHREGETVNSRALITLMALVMGLVALSGCSDNSNELQNLVCEVHSVNDGSPLLMAALNLGNDGIRGTDDDFVPIDFVPVLFRARALAESVNIPEDGAYSSFIITSYDLTWTTTDPNAPVGLTDYNVTGALASLQVRIDSDAIMDFLVGPMEMKGATWFQDILAGTAPPFTARANFSFNGHVSGTDHEVSVPGGLTVNVIGSLVE